MSSAVASSRRFVASSVAASAAGVSVMPARYGEAWCGRKPFLPDLVGDVVCARDYFRKTIGEGRQLHVVHRLGWDGTSHAVG